MPLDRLLHVFRADLADEKLRGRVEAARFVPGILAQLIVPVAGLRPSPDLEHFQEKCEAVFRPKMRKNNALSVDIDTEILLGKTLHIFNRANSWAWVRANADGYSAICRKAPSAP